MDTVTPLRDKLENKIMQYRKIKSVGGKIPEIILMHPKTFWHFSDEVWKFQGLSILLSAVEDIKYRGIKISRTEDIPENEFEVY